MVRHASGVFLRNDRVGVAPGTSVRIFSMDRKASVRAQLQAIGSSDFVVSALRPAALGLGCQATVAVTLPGRYIEFELPCVVDGEDGATFGVRLDYLTARQAYGLALLRELLRQAPTVAKAQRRASTAKR